MKNIKTKVLLGVLSIALVVIAGMNIVKQLNEVELSDLVLANVEALAGCEWNSWIGEPVFHITLTGYCSWSCSRGGVFQCPV